MTLKQGRAEFPRLRSGQVLRLHSGQVNCRPCEPRVARIKGGGRLPPISGNF